MRDFPAIGVDAPDFGLGGRDPDRSAEAGLALLCSAGLCVARSRGARGFDPALTFHGSWRGISTATSIGMPSNERYLRGRVNPSCRALIKPFGIKMFSEVTRRSEGGLLTHLNMGPSL